MTTIAYDGKTIAADGLAVSGTERTCLTARKIIVEHGRVYAFSGPIAMFPALVAWHSGGAEPDAVPKISSDDGWCLVVMERDRPLTMFTRSVPYADVFDDVTKFAAGSGQDYALGALYAGKSAREAVEIAAMIDVRTGGEIIAIDVEKALAGYELAEAAE